MEVSSDHYLLYTSITDTWWESVRGLTTLEVTHTSGNDELLDFEIDASVSGSTEHSTSSSKSMTSPRSLNK